MTAFSTPRPLAGGATDAVKVLADNGTEDGDITLLQIAQHGAAKGLLPDAGTPLKALLDDKADKLEPVTVTSGATLTRAAHFNRLVICQGGTLTVSPAGVQPGDALPLQNSSATLPLVVTVGSLVATVPPASNGLLEYNPGISANGGWTDAYSDKPVNFSATYDVGTGRLTGVTLADGTAVVVTYPSATSAVVARTKAGATQTSTYTLDATGTRVIARSVA